MKLSKFFKDNHDVIIPRVYRKYSTRRVLTTDFYEGENIQKYYGRKAGVRLIKIGTEAMIRQYFELGIFQGDPHPGNFMVHDKRIVFLDLGMIGYFTKADRKVVLRLFLELFNRNHKAVSEILIKLDKKKGDVDYDSFALSNQKLIDNWGGRKVKEFSMAKLLYKIVLNGIKHNIDFPSSFVLFAKSIATLDDLSVHLNPNLDLIEDVKPVLQELVVSEYGFKELLKYELRVVKNRVKSKVMGISHRLEDFIGRTIDSL